jgi:MinD-like ATPase involved in chromosome partitioning or flagellar assembly
LGLNEEDMHHTLNDYLWGKCDIEEAAHDVSANIGGVSGQLLFVPSSIKPGEIARVLREGYDVGLLNDGFQSLIDALDLDVLIIDTHPGMNEETLLSIAISDALVIVMRPDQQDFQGTAVTVDVGRKLDVPDLLLLVNKTPQVYDMDDLKARVESIYNSEVAAVLPHSDELMALASEGVFVVKFPDHEITQKYKAVAERLLRD